MKATAERIVMVDYPRGLVAATAWISCGCAARFWWPVERPAIPAALRFRLTSTSAPDERIA